MELPIRTQRLIIATLEAHMATSVHLGSLDADNRRFVPDEVFETVEAASEAINALIANNARSGAPLVHPILLHDGTYIGHVQAVPIEDGWEIGYHVAKPFTGHGYASEAVRAFVPVVTRHLGITRIDAICRADNHASRRVLEKCGFTLESECLRPYHGATHMVRRYRWVNAPLERMDAFFNARADTYDSHMLDDLGLGAFYEAIADCFDHPPSRLLDLGCGTGLELALLFARFPDMAVTGIDLSADMLRQLERKYPGEKLRLVCGSYFDADWGQGYDAVLSTYSLHHFSEAQKLSLYIRVAAALVPGGQFVLGDYTVSTHGQQQALLAACADKRRAQGIAEDAFYHFDTPLTPETEIRLMKAAGFASVQIVRQWDNTSIFLARK